MYGELSLFLWVSGLLFAEEFRLRLYDAAAARYDESVKNREKVGPLCLPSNVAG